MLRCARKGMKIYDNRYNQIRLKVAPLEGILLKHQYGKSG